MSEPAQIKHTCFKCRGDTFTFTLDVRLWGTIECVKCKFQTHVQLGIHPESYWGEQLSRLQRKEVPNEEA